MTEKQEKILEAALELFAGEGYYATSTSKVAKHAGVSEGLIFRHYVNKEGLLDAVTATGEQRLKGLYAAIVMETEPKEVLRNAIELPFSIKEEEYEFWKLQFKLKWELKKYNKKKLEPVKIALVKAFTMLNYKQPSMEAELLLHLLDGVVSAMLKDMVEDKKALRALLLIKYNL